MLLGGRHLLFDCRLTPDLAQFPWTNWWAPRGSGRSQRSAESLSLLLQLTLTSQAESPAAPLHLLLGGRHKAVMYSSSCDPVGFLHYLSTTAFVDFVLHDPALNSAFCMYLSCTLHVTPISLLHEILIQERNLGTERSVMWQRLDLCIKPSLEVSCSTKYFCLFTVCSQRVMHFYPLH